MAPITVESHGPCSIVILDRPEAHNVINAAMVSELLEALAMAENDPGTRILVITGRGDGAFCAGADVRYMDSLDDAALHRFLVDTRKLFRRLAELSLPTLAAINGHAHGGGAELACICDLRYGSPRATFRFPGLAYGMAVGTWHLPTVVGLPKAKELLLTTDPVDADEALRIGLLNRVFPADTLLERTLKVANRIAEHPREATSRVKSLLDRTTGAPLQQRFFRELYSNRELDAVVPSRERMRRFLDRREPD